MPAALSLEQLVADNLYRNARHRGLLETSPALPWPQLAELQSAYVRTDHPLERDEIAREFQRRVRMLADDVDEQEARELDEAEFEQIVSAEPEEVALEELMAEVERRERRQLADYLRHGEGLTYREIAEALRVSPSTARRLLTRRG